MTMKRKKKAKRGWKTEVKKNWPLYVLLIPSIACVLVFSYAPMGGIYMAFLDCILQGSYT